MANGLDVAEIRMAGGYVVIYGRDGTASATIKATKKHHIGLVSNPPNQTCYSTKTNIRAGGPIKNGSIKRLIEGFGS